VANNKKYPERPSANPAARSAAKPAQKPEETSRLQRLLGTVGGSILGLGVIAVIALLLGESFAEQSVQDNIGIWAIVAFIPDIALPVGFVLIVALLIVTFLRRARAAKVAGK
jgi:TRAP-type C4-dicarboxylate transport system permease small subunit